MSADGYPGECVYVSNVVARCAQTGYALRILRAHGLNGLALWNVTRGNAGIQAFICLPRMVWILG